MLPHVVSVLVPAGLSFFIGVLLTPVVTHYLYAHKAWKKNGGKMTLDGNDASEFRRLHQENEMRAPRMGGIIVWGSAAITTFGLAFAALLFPSTATFNADFLTRSQTWLPFSALLIGAFCGLIDDMLVIGTRGEGLPLRVRLLVVVLLSTFIGWWFYAKLAVEAVSIPFGAPLTIGWLIIPLFIIVSLAVYASGVIDGIDGLSGGVFASIFASYSIIAFFEGQVQTAALCAAIVGGLLAFLWFNIPPARFYMSDTGTMALTLTLAVIAFMTDKLGGGIGISVLPIIGGLLVITVASDIAQVFWKKVFGRKLLRIAPLHHHFEALGWPGYKVVMRYWVLSVIFAIAGVILALAAL